MMLNAMPPRATIVLMGSFHVAMALTWWLSGVHRSDAVALTPAKDIGRHLFPAHPMHFWALLFAVVAVLFLVGAVGNHRHVAGVGCLLGSALCVFYGICSGWAAVQHNIVPFTGLIAFCIIGLWHTLNAVMLLGSPRRRWE